MSDGFDIERMSKAGPVGGSMDAAYNHYYAAGGCVALALAIHSIYPQSTRIAVQWYSDHGGASIAHAVAYDPVSGLGFDAGGARPVDEALDGYSDQYDLERDMQADPNEIAEHMGLDWKADAPFDDMRISEAATFVEGHFLVPQTPAHWQTEIEQQMWYGAPDPRQDASGYREWFDQEAMENHHDYLKAHGPTLEGLDAAGEQPAFIQGEEPIRDRPAL